MPDLFTATAAIPFSQRASAADVLRKGHCSPQCMLAFGPVESKHCSCACQELGYGDLFHGILSGSRVPVESKRLAEAPEPVPDALALFDLPTEHEDEDQDLVAEELPEAQPA